ncbi:MAG: hypothetical protein IJJ60_11760, partial [Clostridia bacterium]|nr:hypothetical protein [Clostridia bacterium]
KEETAGYSLPALSSLNQRFPRKAIPPPVLAQYTINNHGAQGAERNCMKVYASFTIRRDLSKYLGWLWTKNANHAIICHPLANARKEQKEEGWNLL